MCGPRLGAVLALILATTAPAMTAAAEPGWALAIHGGAGVIVRDRMSASDEAAYQAALAQALDAGASILRAGGSALDAVEAAVVVMEDEPLFNAGRGSVFNAAGEIEMDAAIMDGSNRKAGAVAAVRTVRNPVRLARAVMEHSPHVFLMGEGAERFAREQKIARAPASWFRTERRMNELKRARREDRIQLDHQGPPPKFGTVGAVALDAAGNLAAATSTGGMTNKRWGRVGDSPVIGAGTYAANGLAAISGTGEGEYFIRLTIARDIAARMEFGGESLKDAATAVIDGLTAAGGAGGVIAVDQAGNLAMPFNTPGMYRGVIRAGEQPEIAIYGP